jgi:dTDP-4-amino-4,6-dideoxygalactose transaminase
VVQDAATDERLRLLRSFGHVGDEHFCLGMNAKLSEVHAAMGMAVLPHMPAIIASRRAACERYDERLAGRVERPVPPPGTGYNHAYYPVLLPDAAARERVKASLEAGGVLTRRYFFPSLNRLPYVKQVPMPVSDDLAARVLCLPLFAGMTTAQVDRVAGAFLAAIDGR